MDFAIIEHNGKQYKITDSCSLDLEHMDLKPGDKLTFDKVLMISEAGEVKIGTPYLEEKSFEGEVLDQHKGKKISILRFRAKSRHRRKIGFRPQLIKVALGAKPAVKAKVAEKKVATKTTKVIKKEKTSVKTSAKSTSPKTK